MNMPKLKVLNRRSQRLMGTGKSFIMKGVTGRERTLSTRNSIYGCITTPLNKIQGTCWTAAYLEKKIFLTYYPFSCLFFILNGGKRARGHLNPWKWRSDCSNLRNCSCVAYPLYDLGVTHKNIPPSYASSPSNPIPSHLLLTKGWKGKGNVYLYV